MTDFFIPRKNTQDIWYKEPWMLLVLGGPVIVVIAATITGVIAWQGEDKVIAKDYYKQGLNINKDILRDDKASEYKMLANAQFDRASGKVLLQLEGKTVLPASILFSTASNSTASTYELIQKVKLQQVQPNIYEGKLNITSTSETLNATIWHVQIEADDWRLTADWLNPEQTSLKLKSLN
jgi:hypothetical protein